MSVQTIVAGLFIYLLPVLFLFYMAIEVLLRNVHNKLHRLASLIVLSYMLLFIEEFIRHLLPMSYSAPFVTIGFGIIGALIVSFGFHFVADVSSFKDRIPRIFRPYMYYTPVMVVLVSIVTGMNNSNDFVQQGLWKVPVHNGLYYSVITVAILFHILFIVIIVIQRRTIELLEQKRILDILLYSFVFVLGWEIIFGFFHFGPWLPPYPYIFSGVLWCFFLRMAMMKYNFLSSYSKRYEILFNLNPNAILLVDRNGMIKEANPTAQYLLEEANIQDLDVFAAYQTTNQKEWIELYHKIFEKQQPIRQYEAKIESVKDGMTRHLLIDGDFLYVDQQPYFMIIIRNVTSEKQKAEQIEFLAYHDSLTKLPNRRYFYQTFEERLLENTNHKLAIILFDLDYFKQVNDEHGHTIGDEFLVHVAHVLTEFVKDKGFAARLGGDEFVLCLEQIHSLTYVREQAEALQHQFEQSPFQKEGLTIPVQASIGISLYPDHGAEADQLIKQADQSLYKVKNTGKNNYHMEGS